MAEKSRGPQQNLGAYAPGNVEPCHGNSTDCVYLYMLSFKEKNILQKPVTLEHFVN